MDLQTNSGGLFGSLRRVWDTSASIIKNRAELAALELKEEKSRLVSTAIWGGVFVFSSFMAVITIACTLLFLFWEQRLFVAIGLLVFCVIGALAAFLLVKGKIKAPKPFADTIAQLKKDRAWLQRQN